MTGLAKFVAIVGCSIASIPLLKAEPPTPTTGKTNICGIVGKSVMDIRADVTSKDGIIFHETIGDYDTYVDDSQRRLWTFVRADSAKPPAAICRTVVPNGRGSIVHMEILCFGKKKACGTLRDEWETFVNGFFPDQAQ